MALINNQFLAEDQRAGVDTPDYARGMNDPADMAKHPLMKKNMCKHCYQYRTLFICEKCSNPQRARPRLDRGPKGSDKRTHLGYMHFCKKGCFAAHDCGNVSKRRPKGSLAQYNNLI